MCTCVTAAPLSGARALARALTGQADRHSPHGLGRHKAPSPAWAAQMAASAANTRGSTCPRRPHRGTVTPVCTLCRVLYTMYSIVYTVHMALPSVYTVHCRGKEPHRMGMKHSRNNNNPALQPHPSLLLPPPPAPPRAPCRPSRRTAAAAVASGDLEREGEREREGEEREK